jgi:HD-GYP domain-containing protein (c-di-GMP phosphodiesterase class II)
MANRNERIHTPFPTEIIRPFSANDSRTDLIFRDATLAERTYLNVVREWGQSVEFGDEYLRGHCSRVAEHAVALAMSLGTDAQTQTTILAGAYLHGVGRLRVPRTIHQKPGMLTPSERAVVQESPLWGAEILSKVSLPWNVTPIVRWHNERVDGTGYPDGLRGEEIPLSAQIVGITNVFDALISPRAQRKALRPGQAVRELANLQGWWSEEVLQTYLGQLQTSYWGSLRLA